MKGNQGLEALAALCGGRPKAVDKDGGKAPAPATSSSTSTVGTIPSSPARTSPPVMVASAFVKASSPVTAAAAATATANQLLMQQAAERKAAEAAASLTNGALPAHHPQHLAAPTAPISADSSAAPAPSTAPLGNLTTQQLSQAIVAAANSQGGRLDPAIAQSLLYPSGAAATPAPALSAPASGNNILANTMQQLVLQQYLQAQATAQQQQVQQQAQAQAAATAAAASGHPQAALLAMTLAAGKAGQQSHFLTSAGTATAPISATGTTTASESHRANGSPSVQQQAQAQAMLQHAAAQQQQQQLNAIGLSSIKSPAAAISQHVQAVQPQYHFPNGSHSASAAVNAVLPSMIKAAAAGGRILPSTELSPQIPVALRPGHGARATNAEGLALGSKKQQKRAANRRSAQLSRKRKKLFIEELKEENDDLRRKEQILRAIPDLVVVFDSSGRLGFVSESVGRFLDVSPDKLEGTSFWDLICEESVRMLKAAFMDSLAAREADSDTAVLGSGVWKLRLKNKDSKYMVVTLNGVVHFKGDAPECVCCIRPMGEEEEIKEEDQQAQDQQQSSHSQQKSMADGTDETNGGDGANKTKSSNTRAVSCSDGDASRSSDGSNGTQLSVLSSPQRHNQRVSMSSAEQDDAASDAKKRNKKFRRVAASSEEGYNRNSDNDSNNNVEADGTNGSVRISEGGSSDGIESD